MKLCMKQIALACLGLGLRDVSAFMNVPVAYRNAVSTRVGMSTPYFADVAEPEFRLTPSARKPLDKHSASGDVPVQPKKKVVKPNKKAGGKHKQDGLLSPAVLFAKKIMGDQLLNKVRAKTIALHSDVIGAFVGTSDSQFGNAVLRGLFRFADKNRNGVICEIELKEALQSLGFEWIKEKQAHGILARADVDGNGFIDIDEWINEAPKTLRTNLIKLAKKNGGEMGLLA